MSPEGKKVLIAGASGLVGTASVDRFLDEGWEVVAVSRRVPEVKSEGRYTHLPVDLGDSGACGQAFGELDGVTHVVFAALFEKPGLVTGWTEPDYMRTNMEMLSNLLDPLTAGSDSLEHVSLLQGTKAYGFHLGPMPIPAREREPRHQHENFYWMQEDYVREKAAAEGWGWTVLRPHLITGGAYGVAMNMPPVVGAYAAICREEGLEFGFPGGPAAPWEAVDSRVVAGALHWAATEPKAKGETYNVTNGEVFGWRDLWPAIADELGLEPAADSPRPLSTFLPEKAETWERIVRKHDLRRIGMDELLGESHHLTDLVFAHGMEETPPAAFVSTVKIRQAGFNEAVDAEEMWRYWLRDLMARKVIPAAAG